MNAWQTLLGAVGIGCGTTALVGLLVRRRARRCYFFVAYLVLISANGLRLAIDPGAHTWTYWLVTETTARVLSIAVAVEIALRMFASLPRAKRAAQRVILAVLFATVAVLWLSPIPPMSTRGAENLAEVAAFEAALGLLPRAAYGTAWLFTALLIVAIRYSLPLDRVHRTILVGFSAYLMVYAVAIGSLRTPVQRIVVNAVDPLLFAVVLASWAYVAWAPEPPPPAPQRVVARLWPWWPG